MLNRGVYLTIYQSVTLSVSLLISASFAYAGEKVDRTMEVAPSGSLYIDNTRGQLIVEGWDKPQIQLQGELDDSARKLIFKRKGNKSMIKVVMKGMSHRGHGSELKVFIPRDTRVRFRGVDTDYIVKDLNARVEGHTINGDLTVKNVHGKINLSSVSGEVKVVKSSGLTRVESVSGKVNLSGEFKEARLKSMSGNIMVNIDQTMKLKVENVSGDTAINGYLKSNANIHLNSVSGSIHYKAAGEFNGKCQIASQFGGKIHNELTEDKPWGELLEQRKLKFVSGDGSGMLVMNTVSGSVTLDK